MNKFYFPTDDYNSEWQNCEVLKTSCYIFQLCIDVFNQANSQKETEIITYLQKMLQGGNEISLNIHKYNFMYIEQAAILALVKNNLRLWEQLSEELRYRMDVFARCFLVVTNASANDFNWYFNTGLQFTGWAGQQIGSTPRQHVLLKVMFLISYFGDIQTVNQILFNFDYDSYLQEIKQLGFCHIEKTWTTTVPTIDGSFISAADLLKHKNTTLPYEIPYRLPQNFKELPTAIKNKYVAVKIKDKHDNFIDFGYFYGVNMPLVFRSTTSPQILLAKQLNEIFKEDRIITSNKYIEGVSCNILDHSETPMAGRKGEMLSLNLYSGGLSISSLWMCVKQIIVILETFMAAQTLGILNITDPIPSIGQAAEQITTYYEKIYNGIEDALYKLDHGYHNFESYIEWDTTYASTIKSLPMIINARKFWYDTKQKYGDPFKL